MRKIKNKIKTKNKTKRKQGFSVFLCAMLLVSSFPNTAFAEEIPEFTGTAESSFEDGSSLPLFGDGTGVQEQINALPTVEALTAMTPEEQQKVYDQLQAVSNAYEALTDEQKVEIIGADILKGLFEVFNSMAAGETGAFTVTGGTSGTDYAYSDGVLTVNDGANVTISTAQQTSDRIVVSKGAATITLSGVDITAPETYPAIDLSSETVLTLLLAEGTTNTLKCTGQERNDGAPGIHAPNGSTLIIQGSGSLTVNGGTSATGYGGVGIGGKVGDYSGGTYGWGEACGTVIILAENVTAAAGTGAAGSKGDDIGGGKGPPNQDGDDGQGIRPVPGEANTYEVWGELALPEGVTIPEGAILTGEGSLAEGSKIQQTAPTSAPTASQITDTSVTLNAVTGGKTQVRYVCVQGASAAPPTTDGQWDPQLTIPDLMAATAYTFYAQYCESRFYQASPASPGLTVITAPQTSAVSINYKTERITFAENTFEVSSDSNFSNLFQTNGSISGCHALYMRAKVEDGTQAPIRGVTTVSIPPRPNHAEGIMAVNASAAGVNDGKITGVSSDMEYREENITTWTDCTGDTVENLAPGIYYVRTKATEDSFASVSAEVTIGVGNIITIELPTFDSVYAGYMTPDPKPIKIHNSSDQEVTITGVSCNSEAFNIHTEANPDILKVPAGGTNSYYALQPQPGLSPREYASTITVTYRDTNDNSHAVTATARFMVLPQPTVEDDPPTDPPIISVITDVVVSPKQLTLEKGSSRQFTAEVEGTGFYNKEVIWSVSGQTSSQTVIGEDGILTIGKDENASVLTVTAAAAGDGEKSDTAIVTVVDPPIPAVEISEVAVKGNQARVFLSGEAEGAAGYDFVIGKDRDCIQTKEYHKVNKNVLAADTTFYYVGQGTYYAYCHAWRKVDGKKEFGGWSAPYEFTVEAVTPEQPKIRKIKVSKNTVKITYTRSEGATGYDLVLGRAMRKVNGEQRPVDYGELVKKVYKGNTVTATFKNVEKGTYYAGLHAYNRTSKDGKKVFSPWSKVKKLRVR